MKKSISVYLQCLFFLLITVSFFNISRAAIWQVGDGGNFTSIQAALSDAGVNDGDIITVVQGTYYENIDFLGKAVTLSSINPDDPNVVANTIIDGSSPANPAHASVVTFRSGEGRDSVLAGLTLRKGKGTYAGSNSFGGGVLCIGTSPTIAKCVITGNTATHMGGGVHCEDKAGPLISDCTISQNSATTRGGGIQCTYSTITAENCVITGNQSKNGGGICLYNVSGENVIRKTRIVSNTGSLYGGGIYCYKSQVSLYDSIVSTNKSPGGGGVYLYSQSSGTFRNTIFSGNRAANGGGLFCSSSSSPELTNCVIAGNYASTDGGGLRCLSLSNPGIRNCIFWQNKPQQISRITSTPEIRYCFVQNGWGTAGDHNIPFNQPGLDPNFVLAGSWDSSTNWLEVDFEQDGDTAYHLETDSPCVDQGDPNLVPDADETDIDGQPRFCGFGVDIGIDETSPEKRVYNIDRKPWYANIQSAIDAAEPNEELVVDPGRYLENILCQRQVLVRSMDPNHSAYAAATILDGSGSADATVTCIGTDGSEAIEIKGFTITGGSGSISQTGGGIFCMYCRPLIWGCVITGNRASMGGGIGCLYAMPTISHCNISNNDCFSFDSLGSGGGLYVLCCENALIENCLMTGNRANVLGGAILGVDTIGINVNFCTLSGNRTPNEGSGLGMMNCQEVTINNSIIWGNSNHSAFIGDPDEITVSYCDIEGGAGGLGNMAVDPVFVEPGRWDDNGTEGDPNDDYWVEGNYQLKSQVTYWDEVTKSMKTDPNTSLCIDAGNPGWPAAGEDSDAVLYPGENVRVNMGHLGNTERARKGPAGWGNRADLNNDGVVQLFDWGLFMGKWQTEGWSDNYGDISWDGVVDLEDAVIMAENWLGETGWYSGE